MKTTLTKIAFALAPVIDIALVILAAPAGLILLFYRRLGSRQLPVTTAMLKKIGVFPICKHYYEPLFDAAELRHPLETPRVLPGIDFRTDRQLQLLDQLKYAEEFRALVQADEESSAATAIRLKDKNFQSGDADFLFQFVRHSKPGRVVEIGSGNSTRIVARALERNAQDGSGQPRHVCIEPYEMPWLDDMASIELVRSRVEDCDIDWSTYLGEGDFLFIDSSHMIRPQGDVLHEYLEIIPRLASGVYVHVHDIFSPRDYLEQWVREDVKFWNEQYLLEATLGNTSRYEVIAALNLLKHEHYDALHKVCPFLDPCREPGSIYFRIL